MTTATESRHNSHTYTSGLTFSTDVSTLTHEGGMIKGKIPCHANDIFFIMGFQVAKKKRVEYSNVHEAVAHTVSNIRTE